MRHWWYFFIFLENNWVPQEYHNQRGGHSLERLELGESRTDTQYSSGQRQIVRQHPQRLRQQTDRVSVGYDALG